MHKVYGISLGPGDPELITLKALRLLQKADVIFYPGSLKGNKTNSYVYPILEYHKVTNKPMHGFFLNMSLDRTESVKVYKDTANKIVKAYQKEKKVVVVCEGDISLYASFSYILNALQEKNIPIELVSGINSFSLAAAKHQIPLALLNEKIAIIPRIANISIINNHFKDFDTLVLMKIRSNWSILYPEFEKKYMQWSFFYAERLGTSEEFISQNIKEIENRKIPYFSLLIIKKND